jgi:hypothetical protein
LEDKHAEKIIGLLERIADTSDKLLAEQRQSDEEMRSAMQNLPFNQTEEEDKKSTEPYYNQKIMQAAKQFAAQSPWAS